MEMWGFFFFNKNVILTQCHSWPPADCVGAPGGDGGVPEALQNQPESEKEADGGFSPTGGHDQPHPHPAEGLYAEGRLWLQVSQLQTLWQMLVFMFYKSNNLQELFGTP